MLQPCHMEHMHSAGASFQSVCSFHTSASGNADDTQAREQRVTFPPAAAGGVILGPLQPSEDAQSHERIKKIIRARVFDNFYQDGVGRTGRKTLARALKGDFIGDYYMDKITDPLMTNPDGREAAAIRAERNARGFKRRRPEKKVKKGK